MKDELLITCPHCQTKNRISVERFGQEANCGKCARKFIANYTKPVAVTDSSFSQEVLASPIPVLVDFWAPWCGPCRMVAPILEQLAQEFAGKIKVAKVNTDENQQYAGQYQVQGIPTLLFVKQGQVIEQVVGVAQKPVLQQKIRQLLSA